MRVRARMTRKARRQDANDDADVGAVAIAVACARAGVDARATSRWARTRAHGMGIFMCARIGRLVRAGRGCRARTGREWW